MVHCEAGFTQSYSNQCRKSKWVVAAPGLSSHGGSQLKW